MPTHQSPTSSTFMYADTNETPPAVDWRTKGAVTDVKDQAKMRILLGVCSGLCNTRSKQASYRRSDFFVGTTIGRLRNEREPRMCERLLRLHNQKRRPLDGVGLPICGGRGQLRFLLPFRKESSGQQLMKAVANQPVSVAIDASDYGFRFYSSGFFTGEDCGRNLNHAVSVGNMRRKQRSQDFCLEFH